MHGGISLVGALATWVAIRPLNSILAPASANVPETKAAGALA